MVDRYFKIGVPANIVAQTKSADLLKFLETITEYTLSNQQYQVALAIVQQVHNICKRFNNNVN